MDGIFGNIAQINMMVVVDRNIKDGRVVGTITNMYFRDNGLVEAGCRFPGMPEKMEMNAKNYIEAFKIGVDAANKAGGVKTSEVVREVIEDTSKEPVVHDEVNDAEVIEKVRVELQNAIKSKQISRTEYAALIKEYGFKKLDEATAAQALEIRDKLLG